jgi:TRIAD3 protein (E3 ubiquitin-protein ligase RNF216)
MSCSKILEIDHIGIKCVQNHNICSGCSKYFIETIFENPHYSIPVKCPDCSQEVPSLIFERQLKPEQLEIYQLYIIQNKISSDEKFQCCPHCKYFEIWMKESSANFFYCKNPKCKKLTCSVCIKDVQLPETDKHLDYFELESLMLEESLGDDDEETYEESLARSDGIFYHFKCGLMKEKKESIEKIIEKGAKRRCPSCKLSGRKDDACTHMTCPKCSTVLCYFCEKDVKQLGNDDIFEHNSDWVSDSSTNCPMYLTQIS